MTIRYFKKIKNRLTRLEWLTERVSIDTEYDEDADAGIIGGSIIFKDGSIFHFKEVLFGKNSHYRFHYMDERNNLICRWDTAPHYKNLKTFPYHVHLPDGVKESMQVTLIDVLDTIPDTTKQVFEAIRKAKPPRLYVAADGPRALGEREKCEQVRRIATQVDWDCDVKNFFRDKNLGCRVAVSSTIDWFFENEEEGIILEDDCLPSQSFFCFVRSC